MAAAGIRLCKRDVFEASGRTRSHLAWVALRDKDLELGDWLAFRWYNRFGNLHRICLDLEWPQVSGLAGRGTGIIRGWVIVLGKPFR